MIDLSTVSFVGPEADDLEVLAAIPEDYRSFLQSMNGCILFGGGLHIRGVCKFPAWHSLRQLWIRPDALSTLYTSVEVGDVPFAQDFSATSSSFGADR